MKVVVVAFSSLSHVSNGLLPGTARARASAIASPLSGPPPRHTARRPPCDLPPVDNARSRRATRCGTGRAHWATKGPEQGLACAACQIVSRSPRCLEIESEIESEIEIPAMPSQDRHVAATRHAGQKRGPASLRCPRDLPPRCRCRRTPPERRREREQRRQAWQPEERQEPHEGAWTQSASSWAPWEPRPPLLSEVLPATVAALRQPPAWLFCTPGPAARAGGDCRARNTRSCSAERVPVPRVVAASCLLAAHDDSSGAPPRTFNFAGARSRHRGGLAAAAAPEIVGGIP